MYLLFLVKEATSTYKENALLVDDALIHLMGMIDINLSTIGSIKESVQIVVLVHGHQRKDILSETFRNRINTTICLNFSLINFACKPEGHQWAVSVINEQCFGIIVLKKGKDCDIILVFRSGILDFTSTIQELCVIAAKKVGANGLAIF